MSLPRGAIPRHFIRLQLSREGVALLNPIQWFTHRGLRPRRFEEFSFPKFGRFL
jgi:hypothetical protein